MNADDLKTLNLIMAIAVTVGAVSWAVIMLQAFFHDRRIAIVGLFGALLASYAYFFAAEAGQVVRMLAGIINLGLIFWFLVTNIRRISVWIPVSALFASVGIAWYFMNDFTRVFGM